MSYNQIVVNKQQLEVNSDFNIAFAFENQFFQFENFKLSRSQNFKIPKTAYNNKILGFSDDMLNYGTEMRRVYECKYLFSGGQIDGKLYIIDFSKNAYNCAFVFGEMLKLKEIKEAGNISEYLQINDFIDWDENTPVLDGNSLPEILALQRYRVKNLENEQDRGLKWNFMPSTSLWELAQLAANYFNVNIIIDTQRENYLKRLGVKLNGLSNGQGQLAPDSDLTSTKTEIFGFDSNFFDLVVINTRVYLRAKVNFTAIITKQNYYDEYAVYENAIVQRGIRVYDNNYALKKDIYKKPEIVEEKIELQKGDYLFFYKLQYKNINSLLYLLTFFDAGFLATLKYAGSESSINYPATYYLRPNLPKINFIQILRIFAHLTYSTFYVDNTQNNIIFFDYNFKNSKPIFIDDVVISVENVKRTILDYSQNNVINCKSSNNVLSNNKLTINYIIDNKSLTEEKEIFTIPFSEGNKGEFDSVEGAYECLISDIEVNQNQYYKHGTDADTLYLSSEINNCVSVLIQYNATQNYLASIFEKSTLVEVLIRQTLSDFLKINGFTTFLFKYQVWAVVQATWEKNTTRLTLIKI